MDKLKQKYSNKRVNANKEKIPFNLTFLEFKKLADEAGICASDMGIKGYHLARINDIGPYAYGNCRFIYYKENYAERKVSEKSRLASRNTIIKVMNNETESERKKRLNKAKINQRKWWDSLSEEQKNNYKCHLSEYEIKRRHEIIKKIPSYFGRLTIASKIVGITPQALGRFLKKYPII